MLQQLISQLDSAVDTASAEGAPNKESAKLISALLIRCYESKGSAVFSAEAALASTRVKCS